MVNRNATEVAAVAFAVAVAVAEIGYGWLAQTAVVDGAEAVVVQRIEQFLAAWMVGFAMLPLYLLLVLLLSVVCLVAVVHRLVAIAAVAGMECWHWWVGMQVVA